MVSAVFGAMLGTFALRDLPVYQRGIFNLSMEHAQPSGTGWAWQRDSTQAFLPLWVPDLLLNVSRNEIVFTPCAVLGLRPNISMSSNETEDLLAQLVSHWR